MLISILGLFWNNVARQIHHVAEILSTTESCFRASEICRKYETLDHVWK